MTYTLRFFPWWDKDGALLIVPSDWRDFNRMCWRIYGTGRTEPDEVKG